MSDADEGTNVFSQCKGCYEIGDSARDRIEPYSKDIFGRQSAAPDDFRYSKSMHRARSDGLIWTAWTLEAYTENPRTLVSETRMRFRGDTDARDLANVLACLRTFLNDLSNIPEAESTARLSNPFRDPPDPYQRISLVAHALRKSNATAKILVADSKPKFSNMSLCQADGADRYPGMIDCIGEDFGGGNLSVDPGAMTINLDGETIKVDACNVIPAMKAERVSEMAGVTDGHGAPVNAADMRENVNGNIYILGGAADQGDTPKAGFAANSRAKVCANTVRGALTASHVFSAKFTNTCWSLIDTDNGVDIGATYEATGETAELRNVSYEESEALYEGIIADMFSYNVLPAPQTGGGTAKL